MANAFIFYWMSGCSSCRRTMEFLENWGVGFESVNLSEEPDRIVEVERFGLMTVPGLARGNESIFAQDLADVARFVGVAQDRRVLAHLN